MGKVIKFPTPEKEEEENRQYTNRLVTRAQKAIKSDIDMHHTLSQVLYDLEKLILQDVQTPDSAEALQGVYNLIRWNYDKTQRLSDML